MGAIHRLRMEIYISQGTVIASHRKLVLERQNLLGHITEKSRGRVSFSLSWIQLFDFIQGTLFSLSVLLLFILVLLSGRFFPFGGLPKAAVSRWSRKQNKTKQKSTSPFCSSRSSKNVYIPEPMVEIKSM